MIRVRITGHKYLWQKFELHDSESYFSEIGSFCSLWGGQDLGSQVM